MSEEKGGSGDSTKSRRTETAVPLAGDRAQGLSSLCLLRNLQ